MNYRITIIVLILIVVSLSVNAQKYSAFSNDGKLLSVWSYDIQSGKSKKVKTCTLRIFDAEAETQLYSVELKTKSKIRFLGGGFHSSNEYYYLNDARTLFIGQVGKKKDNPLTYKTTAFCFMPKEKSVAMLVRKGVSIIDLATGSQIKQLTPPKGLIITSLQIVKDNLIFAKTKQNKFVIFNTQTDSQTVLDASEIRLNQDARTFTVLKKTANEFYITVLSLNTFEEIGQLSSTKLIKYKAIDELLQNNLSKEPIYTLGSSPKIDTTGTYVAVVLLDSQHKQHLLVTEILDPEFILNVKNKKEYNELKINSFSFIDDRMMRINTTGKESLLLNYRKKIPVSDIIVRFPIGKGREALALEYQKKNIKFSPNQRLMAIQSKDKKNKKLFLQYTQPESKPQQLNDKEFICFSEDNNTVVVADINENVIFTRLESETENYVGLMQTELDFEIFIGLQKEKHIKEDYDAPDGFEYIKLENLRHISEATETSMIKMYMKAVSVKGNETKLHLQLLDKEGNYYYGASAEEWKSTWCTFKLFSLTGEEINVDSFYVTEVSTIIDSTIQNANATVIILDHSGSMGEDRASVLQNAAYNYIENKAENDIIALIKFDDNIKVECPPSTDKNKLLSSLERNGLDGFGGSTALVSSIEKANSILFKLKDYKRKTILVLTDGIENASEISPTTVLKNSLDGNISVFTIGFGQNVDDRYLKAFSSITEGTFYQIFKTEDFNWIFDDVTRKMQNYYTIHFKTDKPGYFLSLVEICLNNKKVDSLSSYINNNPVILEDVNFETAEFYPTRLPDVEMVEDIVEKEITKEFEKIDLKAITFETNKTESTQNYENTIAEIVKILIKYPDIKLEIYGHTDSIGSKNENLELSKDRAETIKKLLVNNGIAQSRILTFGLGTSKPIASNNTEEGRALNRRVEFVIKLNQD